jgi:hypothetical protein
LMLLAVLATAVLPGLFMLLFVHHTFMSGYYILENVMIFIQRIDLWFKAFNDRIKDGKGVVLFFDFMRPLARAAADQLVELNKEMKSPKPEEADEPKAEVKAEPKEKVERKYF